MANIITDSAVRAAQNDRQYINPVDKILDQLPRKWCKTCERYLEDHPEINTDKYAGQFDCETGQVSNIDRLLEMREDWPPNSGIWIHRYSIPGRMLHEEAVKNGY